jgi:Arc/MetJ-type ribon-helix-helix transcriptional regulator
VNQIYHLVGWFKDGFLSQNAKLPVEARSKLGESEKITINLGYVDLGSIDLLVSESFYANRTDFIRTAIRNLLDRHADTTRQNIARNKFDIGIRRFTRQDLEEVKAAGEVLNIQILGLASIASDVPPELAVETIASLHVLGALDASPAVKAALGDRVK